MIILISPAKNMDFSSPLPDFIKPEMGAEPVFQNRAVSLVRGHLVNRDPGDFSRLMGVSGELARKTSQFYGNFGRTGNPVRPALFAYRGAVFQNMDPLTLDSPALAYGEKHLRILSALYGCLRPLDRIEPYRLDMKTPLPLGTFRSLPEYWKEGVTDFLNQEAERAGAPCFLNLASAEFVRALDLKRLNRPVITVNFKERQRGRLVTVGTYAKMARGRMVRRILEEKPHDPQGIMGWDIMGYTCRAGLSGGDEILFLKD